MESIFRLIEKLGVLKAILLVLVVVLVVLFVWRNFDFLTEITFKIERPRSGTELAEGEETRSRASFRIHNVKLPDVDFDLPTAFYAEVVNEGQDAGAATVTVDFGRANIENFEIRPPEEVVILAGGEASNVLKLRLRSVRSGERIYLYALLTTPVFRSITVDPDASPRRSFTFNDYETRGPSGPLLVFGRLFMIIGVVFFSVMAVDLTVVPNP